jgi:23S rRNA (cytosine1962-C5)-methyltransferase
MGVSYAIQARHGGQDPWLFLDLRAARRRVMAEAAGKSVLNLFAYTCGVGIRRRQPVRKAWSMSTSPNPASPSARKTRASTTLPIAGALRQVRRLSPRCASTSGIGQARWCAASACRPSPKLGTAPQFDLVFLDPPRYAKSPFGVVDLVNDYAALFKPALLSHGGRRHADLLQQRRRGRSRNLAGSAGTKRAQGIPAKCAKWSGYSPEADFPSRGWQAAAQDRPAPRLGTEK